LEKGLCQRESLQSRTLRAREEGEVDVAAEVAVGVFFEVCLSFHLIENQVMKKMKMK